MTIVLPTLSNIKRHDVDQVGPKFHRLGFLARAGLTTPDFICLPRSLFDRFSKSHSSDISPLLDALDRDDPQTFKNVAHQIREMFLESPLAGEVQSEILDAFDECFDAKARVAVRATIIGDQKEEGEDGVSEPFAGMSESYLNVQRSELISRVRLCWASGFSEQAMLYRQQQGYDRIGFGVGVAIQQMVASSESFVAFSCDPQTQARETVIAAGHGLGTLVVQEKTDIEHVRVDHRTGRISRTPAKGRAAVLSDEQVRLVDHAARKLESIFGHPQDIEGSFDKSGVLFILQSRPVATRQHRYRLWSSANISESFPGVTTPLTFSVARRFYSALNRDYYRRCGVSQTKMHAVNAAFDRLLGYLDGRIYHCITNFQLTTAIHPLARFFESDYDRFVCELDRDYKRPKAIKRFAWLFEWTRIAWAASVAVSHYFTLPWKFWRFRVWWNKLKNTIGDNSVQQKMAGTNEKLDHLWCGASRRWGITLVNYQQMVFFHSIAEKLLARWCAAPQATLAELLGGGNRLFGSEVVARALEIADAIRSDKSLAKTFINNSAETIWREIETGRFDQHIATSIKQHLEQYGARGLEELKMEVPNLRNQPAGFIRLLQNYVQGSQRYSDLIEHEKQAARRGIWSFAKSVYFNPVKVATMLVVIKSLQHSLERREIGRYMRGELFGFTKEYLFTIADELVARDCIDSKHDAIYLSVEELTDFVEGRSYTQNLKALIEIRRKEATTFRTSNPRKELATYGIVSQGISQEPSEATTDDRIVGLGSCAGIVRGRARVIHRPSLSEQLEEDDILVAPETDPGWLYLMLGAKGIVVERGSLLSHTAITGRGFAIPTVVAAAKACRLITDGDEIQIDGQTGTVEILKRARHDEFRASGSAAG